MIYPSNFLLLTCFTLLLSFSSGVECMVCVPMQWRLHYTLVFRHIQQRATEWRVAITHARCPIPLHSAPIPPIPEWGPRSPSETWAAVVAITTGHHMLQLPPVPLYSCVCVCVLNIAIYHANAFFNFNMPPGIIKTLQTHNMSQEPRVVEKRHGGKLSPQMMRYHMLHGKKHWYDKIFRLYFTLSGTYWKAFQAKWFFKWWNNI